MGGGQGGPHGRGEDGCTLGRCATPCHATRRRGGGEGINSLTSGKKNGEPNQSARSAGPQRSGFVCGACLHVPLVDTCRYVRRGFSFLRCDSVLVVTSTQPVPPEHAAQGTSGAVVYRITLTASRHSDSVRRLSLPHCPLELGGARHCQLGVSLCFYVGKHPPQHIVFNLRRPRENADEPRP